MVPKTSTDKNPQDATIEPPPHRRYADDFLLMEEEGSGLIGDELTSSESLAQVHAATDYRIAREGATGANHQDEILEE